MRKYSNSIVIKYDTSATGNAGSGKPVTVYDTGTLVKSSIFEDDQITPMNNPLYADDEGNYSFTVNDGVYDLVIDEGLPTETRITKVQIANIIDDEPDNTFTKYNIVVSDGQSEIIMPEEFQTAIVIIDGITQAEGINHDYVTDGQNKTITMNAPFTFLEEQKVQVWVNDMFLSGATSSIGKISNYLDAAKTNFGQAIEQCCLENDIVDLEGLVLSTDDEVNLAEGSKVKEIWFNGADVTIKSSAFNVSCLAPKFKGPGVFRGGAQLKQVATESASDTKILKLTNVDDLEIGQFVNSSLDVFYLPNAEDRVGYINEGDYNRITDINAGTNEITLTYNFLRTADYTVSSGILQNAWVGINTTFNSAGIHFLHPDHQDIIFEDLTFEYWAGYVIFRRDEDVNIADVGSRLFLTRCVTQNQFLDIFQFRGLDVICDAYKCSRQYDFAKQHFVLNQPTHGKFVIKNGCYWERQNFDQEIYNTNMGIDPKATAGKIVCDGSNTFLGYQPVDLPTSDYAVPPIGQLYFGIQVPIFDSLHFYAPAGSPGAVTNGFYSYGDKFMGYSRSIFGTIFTASTVFEYNECVFVGSEVGCEPIYVNVSGKDNDQLRQDYQISLVGGTYYSRNADFCRGVRTSARDVNLILTDEARITPQVDGIVGLNNIDMKGGKINGRYKLESANATFEDVHLAYQGTDNLVNVVLLSDAYFARKFVNNFILDAPADFENTGNSIDDWAAAIPTDAWFGSNVSGFAPSPDVRFKIDGRQNQYVYGNNFGKQYFQEILTTREDTPPFPTKGLFSSRFDSGDTIRSTAEDKTLVVSELSQATTTTNASLPSVPSDIIVADAPTLAPTHISVYSGSLKSWFYYTVANVAGNTITPSENIQAEFSVGDNVYLISAQAQASGSDSVKVRRNVDDGVTPGIPTTVTFEELDYDELPGSYVGPTADRLTVPAGVNRVDVASFMRYLNMDSGIAIQHRIDHYDSVGTKLDVVASNQGVVGYQQQMSSTVMLDVEVNEGDYFQVRVLHNNPVNITINRATFSMRKVK